MRLFSRFTWPLALGLMISAAAQGAGAAGVTVLRGTPAEKPVPAPVVARPLIVVLPGGSPLWGVDPRTGRLRACWVRGTGRVGKTRIHCSRRR